jgi:hypothetical protein
MSSEEHLQTLHHWRLLCSFWSDWCNLKKSSTRSEECSWNGVRNDWYNSASEKKDWIWRTWHENWSSYGSLTSNLFLGPSYRGNSGDWNRPLRSLWTRCNDSKQNGVKWRIRKDTSFWIDKNFNWIGFQGWLRICLQ